MKKYNFLVLLLTFIVLATSCNKDDSIYLQNSENNRVTLSANMENEVVPFLKSSTQSRASGNLQVSGYSLRYILEVWDENAAVAYREEKLVADASQTVTFDFNLPDAGDYDALLWADYVTEGTTETDGHYSDLYYTTNDAIDGLKAISIIGSAYAINTASRDAFFGKSSFTKVDGTPGDAGNITLKRPFGRINIIEKNATLLAELTSMDLTYDVPSGFNVFDGTINGSYSVFVSDIASFPTAAIENANLFFDYILAPATGQELLEEIRIDYTLTTTAGTFTIPANMPVERNKRTNISGSILNDPSITGLSVEIDDVWFDIDYELSATATVGSYYYEGGLFSESYNPSLTCLGIVFEVDATGKHGKIISLDQGDNLEWYRLSGVTTDATSNDNGAENTAIINSLSDWRYYYAFEWCINKGSGWYLPARDELEALKTAWNTDFDAFNAKLTYAGGTIISLDGRYWSSTERTFNTAYYLDYSYGILNAMKIVDGFSARAMMTF